MVTRFTIAEHYRQAIEAEMRAALGPFSSPFYHAIHYHLGWTDEQHQPVQIETGKRLRPILCLLACEAVGGDYRQAVPAAAAIELVHNFSLIHDDIEDQSDERHGRSTVWRIWGEAQAINAGDGLLALARYALWNLGERGVPAKTVIDLARLIDLTCLRLCEGQFLDISFEQRLDVTVDEYLAMIDGKSAALISYATEAGARLGEGDPNQVLRLARFGRHLGLAFQVRDDILGIWGNAGQTGKSVESDLATRKKSLPVVYALQAARLAEREQLLQFYGSAARPAGAEQLGAIADLLERLGARAFAQEQAERYAQLALEDLAAIGENPATESLRQLTIFVTRREH